ALVNEVGGSLQYSLVISTWPFLEAIRDAWTAVDSGFSGVDAVVEGFSSCEKLRCDGTDAQMSKKEQNWSKKKEMRAKRRITNENW
ncbi:hypothetical protein HAX54_006499, partial [Datura stramonium]|nr:hypothetical protein [Datura stramonium]